MLPYTPQALSSLAAMAAFLKGSPWEFSDDELQYLTNTVNETYKYVHFDSVSLGLSGRMFSNNMLEQTFSMLDLAIAAGHENSKSLTQSFLNTFRNEIGTHHAPLERLNQQGFPDYISAFTQAIEKVQKYNIIPKAQAQLSFYPLQSCHGHEKK